MVGRRWNWLSWQFTDKLDAKYLGVSVKSPINHRTHRATDEVDERLVEPQLHIPESGAEWATNRESGCVVAESGWFVALSGKSAFNL